MNSWCLPFEHIHEDVSANSNITADDVVVADYGIQDNDSVATDTNAVTDTCADTDNSFIDEIPSYYEGTRNEVSAQLLSSV